MVVWAVALIAWLTHRDHTPIALAAAFDFVVTASVVAWWFELPRGVTAAVFSIGMVLAKLALANVMILGILLELALVASVIVRGRRSFVARILLMELRILSMVITGWRRPVPKLTVHGSWSLYAGVIAFLVLVEAAVLHLVVAVTLSTTIAWIVTGLSLYSALWLIGDALALRHGGITREGDALVIHVGLRHRVTVPLADLVAIEGAASDAMNLAVREANTVLRLRAPVEVHSLFRRPRLATALALSVDDRGALTALTT